MNDQRNTMLSFFGYNHEDKEAFEKAEHNQNSWIVHQEADELFGDQVTSSTKRADGTRYIKSSDDDDLHEDDSDNGTLRERSPKNRHGFLMKHVPHREKPPQAVAKRNARERRRVQAVNSAFVRLRKVVPFENTRGKRISKVKTLHRAIEYIQGLQELLLEEGAYVHRQHNDYNYNCHITATECFFEELAFGDGFQSSGS